MVLFEAVEFICEITQGATSRPWLIRAVPQGSEVAEELVVKLYKSTDDEISYCVLKELSANRLCKQFDLNTPQAHLVFFSNDFKETLTPAQKNSLKILMADLYLGPNCLGSLRLLVRIFLQQTLTILKVFLPSTR